MNKSLQITDVVLRDAHQSLFATRLRIEDMLPIAEKLDRVGYWSLETWGGATFDACIRFLGEDPWERLRCLKATMPNTRQQMLLRGQNALGYRHYADDVINKFVERAAKNGMDVFRIFDAMNDVRNLQTAVKATIGAGRHAQGTICYTDSPVHTMDTWVDMARHLEDMGCHSIAIKDMAGLLKPYTAYELVTKLKETTELPIALHSHATTGMSTTTLMKAAEAGLDIADTSISSMSLTYGHSPTESMVAMLDGSERDTGLDIHLLEEIAIYFREVRKKYAAFEGSLKGVDPRILIAQVPGGMLTNMENQLREQNALDRMDEVLAEIPAVRKDLGYIPLVTPTSQIVGTQSVINVLSGERYKTISRETAGVLKGEYGTPPGEVNEALQRRVLNGGEAITCRPADILDNEMDILTSELKQLARDEGFDLAKNLEDDVLIYAQFPEIGLKFLKNRGSMDAFEPVPTVESAQAVAAPAGGTENYRVNVDGHVYNVQVEPATGDILASVPTTTAAPGVTIDPTHAGEIVTAPLAGSIIDIPVQSGDQVSAGQVVIVIEAMKMETQIRCSSNGHVASISVNKGDNVQVDQSLLSIL